VRAETGVLEVEARIEAPPETVFAYFTDAERYRRWMGQDAELDPRPGGLYRVRVNDRQVVRGVYVELDPPQRLVFTWGWEGDADLPPGSTAVEVTLVPDGDHTIVRVRHSGFPSDAVAQVHEQGWRHYLQRLSVAGPGGDPGADSFAAG
jgi:uncharacterized protein YndB with AHSA1/START domain